MTHFLFLDESGHDRKEAPYEVLAGVTIEDRDLWNLIAAVQDSEVEFFGFRRTDGDLEIKGNKLLKRKTFDFARQADWIPPGRRTELVASLLEKGRRARREGWKYSGETREELTALGQAKIAFVQNLLELCARYQVSVFGSVVDRDAPRPESNFLRKDYAYLFERFFEFLDQKPDQPMGIVVFDELDQSQCHFLIDQMGFYFRETQKGRMRASRIVPEPFFVRSHLTTGVQIADIVAYIINWGVRVGWMDREVRPGMEVLAEQVKQLRWHTFREGEDGGGPYDLWSLALIPDLRPREERGGE